ncbi:LysR family transcriptional regulator [Rhizobium leguminosarum bv. trifolii CB782]|uniref:HTH-type transcriptional regulator TtuA n=1 Tax=Rhizobium hidalgonense TaxID=1538159 RepID=A0A2A6KHE7_9HYPH|nr:LysR family transcriptional regulator [Rhizobium hidalgonense]AHG47764.1 LysR family transcriptional regulator [Rhizobium leguminosarum bv. trifolii CB782]MDR9774266.1 LysR substrate-binding domain-containing protein [Rhizobium hidalgonense]MDR9804460.1 LysR substrate-binding domain-containing protein [Rhizobium hidalgonense]MDR9811974.1 LysR substrate-binding domain-containing protein [Rhizobium hidalgonense]MDR9820446.1 LysR substrate-binding domain-containing protein [Rhizobium hidalgone
MEAINLNRLAYFAAVVGTGSFTRAADRLGITKTVVSQQVARLEAELETSLLIRTTRRVEPTEAGRMLYARCVMILREAEDAVDELSEARAEPMGVLRIAAPNDYGASMIAPLAVGFARRFPACTVDLVLSDARADLVADHIDVSIRVGWLDDSTLQARRIGTFRQLLVASANQLGTIAAREPEDLAALPFIANGALREPLLWHFARGDFDRRAVRMRQALSINTTTAVLAATLAGGGLSVLPDFQVADHLGSGRLVEVLPEWSLPSGGIHAVYPAARFRPPKVTAFVAMLVDEIRRSERNR